MKETIQASDRSACLADRTNGRALQCYVCLSIVPCLSACNVMYCG